MITLQTASKFVSSGAIPPETDTQARNFLTDFSPRLPPLAFPQDFQYQTEILDCV